MKFKNLNWRKKTKLKWTKSLMKKLNNQIKALLKVKGKNLDWKII